MRAILEQPGKLMFQSHWLAGTDRDAHNGACVVKARSGVALRIIYSDGGGWDHVSVSTTHRCPTWDEMQEVREMFFEPHECAMQLHPPLDAHINVHPYCLHLWRPQDEAIPMPPLIMVAPGAVPA